ncbi:BMP family ABC transporter substrate-binding protein [Streptomyces sp. NBC_01171]|uniref:BMP family ABC transporter substrate-binding protein n=1 Tax=Streptomyces sp. NBC_01171 TaxID=2903757 RepID=UPI00386A2478|nr:BMP family ABC transporter substrate-binding protein [Streptomyces sp. NBC_01171]
MKTRRGWRANTKAPENRYKMGLLRAMTAAARLSRDRRAWIAAGAVLVVAVAVGVWVQLAGRQDGPPDTRARQYREFDACLLTGDKGIAEGTRAASAWEGMQRASSETRARINYVPVTGAQSVTNTRPFLNSLMQRQCGVLIAVGAPQSRVAQEAAAQHPEVWFVLVDGASTAGRGKAGNVTVAEPDDSLPGAVADVIRRAVDASGQ